MMLFYRRFVWGPVGIVQDFRCRWRCYLSGVIFCYHPSSFTFLLITSVKHQGQVFLSTKNHSSSFLSRCAGGKSSSGGNSTFPGSKFPGVLPSVVFFLSPNQHAVPFLYYGHEMLLTVIFLQARSSPSPIPSTPRYTHPPSSTHTYISSSVLVSPLTHSSGESYFLSLYIPPNANPFGSWPSGTL